MARYYETDYGQGSRRGPDETERGPSRRADDEARTWFGDEETARQHSRFTDVMRAGDLMTPNPLTVHPRDLVDYAARLMRDCDCGVAPVVDQGGRLIGMVSDRDIVVRLIAERVDARN